MSQPVPSSIKAPSSLWLFIPLLVFGATLIWLPTNVPSARLSPEPTGLYQYLTAGIAEGRLSLSLKPAPEMLALPDPYDPERNVDYRVNDASLYRENYYLYHGVAPVLLLYLPVKWVTGAYLANETASLIFCLVLVGGIFWVWRHSLRLAQRRAGPMAALLLGVALASSWIHVVLRTPAVNGVAIAAASALAMLGLGSALRACLLPLHAGRWLALASTAFGLAIASRPNYAFAAISMLVPLWFLGVRPVPTNTIHRRRILAAVLPGTALVGLLIAYNLARFGHPFEFGQSYMLGAWDQREMPAANSSFAWRNFAQYLWGGARYSRFFPFVTPVDWQTIGVIRHLPWLLAGGIAGVFVLAKRSVRQTTAPLLMLGMAGALNFLTLVFLPSADPDGTLSSANARYVLDFLPLWASFAGLGLLFLGSRSEERGLSGGRRAIAGLRGLGVLLALPAVLVAISLRFAVFAPSAGVGFVRWLNQPTAWWDSWHGLEYGPISVTLRFPTPSVPGRREILVSTGNDRTRDCLFVDYLEAGQARLGLISDGLGGPLGEPFQLPPNGAPVNLEIQMGSLLPPINHPALRSWTYPSVSRAQRRVRAQIGDQLVLDDVARFHAAEPDQVAIGEANAGLPAFSGQIENTKRLPLDPTEFSKTDASASYGAWALAVRFGIMPVGTREPLVVSGEPGAGDFIYIIHEPAGIRFGVDHWGYPGLLSGVIPLDRKVVHQVEVHSGALLPPASDPIFGGWPRAMIDQVKNQIEIRLDGVQVLAAAFPSYDSSPFDVTLGRNTLGGSTCGYAFSGEIVSAQRLPLPTHP